MKTIGIIGGMGATTGVDLANKIIEQTQTENDHDCIPMVLLSYPHQIPDRTAFLQAKTQQNPAKNIVKLIQKLEIMDANVIGMPCNTAHAPKIYNPIIRKLKQSGSKIKLVNMLDATAEFLSLNYPHLKRIGLLATLGTYQTKVYESRFSQYDIQIINPSTTVKESTHDAIYGIKSGTGSECDKTHQLLYAAIENLAKNKAQAIILGCSEIALVIKKSHHQHIPLFDPTTILARKLIQLTQPEKLKPLHKNPQVIAFNSRREQLSSMIDSLAYK
ncbi:MAG: amino acid racemase [Methylococcaceae bacterium]|nr:amino acid racemase [Methylococcaceae bacterium]